MTDETDLAPANARTTPAFAASSKLVIHEWGTFTSLQDEDGYALGGMNGDDEALPPFVHDLIRGKDKDPSFSAKQTCAKDD